MTAPAPTDRVDHVDQYGKGVGQGRALVVGAGGLGTPALLALAEGGVRRLAVIDPDRVELSNLHRQFLYTEEDVGQPKAERLARAVEARFPGVEVEPIPAFFEAKTHHLVSGYDVVLDGTDLFETKIAISDACLDRGVDYVFAGVVAEEGQVMAVRPRRSACLRCLFDGPPPPGAAPTCAEVGVIGPVAGIVAAEQARAALALLSGDPSVLDKLWIYDGRRDRARNVSLRRAEDCQGCGRRRTLRGSAGGVEPRAGIGDEVLEEAPIVDLSGLVCPSTYVETARALDRLPSRGRVWVHLTSDEAARNVPRSAIAAGHRVLRVLSDGRTHRFLLERGPSEESV